MRHRPMRDRRGPGAARAGLTGLALVAALALGACQTPGNDQASVEGALDVASAPGAAEAVDINAAGEPVVEPNVAAGATAATPQAFAANAPRVHFAPVVGAPVEKVSALSQRLSTAAPQSNIRLEPSASGGAEHEIRGYFSALSENGSTTVIHVWDVFTPSGQRVHRIQGQERVPGASGDPWAAVPASVMQTIADRMLADYLAWRGRAA
ncbi:MAG: hypothetical protein RIB53_15110 [Roseitalea porphyridii]|uniref:hypothetical protein n=1 Tax=Roseitalea porphyridii TaxID=1852022 RepID=UPI0032EAD703